MLFIIRASPDSVTMFVLFVSRYVLLSEARLGWLIVLVQTVAVNVVTTSLLLSSRVVLGASS